MTKRTAYVIPALAALVLLAACNPWSQPTGPDIDVNVAVSQSQAPAPGPSSSPSPSSCDLGALRPGTFGDARDIPQGETIEIGVTLLGTQGLELPTNCLGQYTPIWTGGTPCLLSGPSGYDIAMSAPESAPLDAVCEAQVAVANLRGFVRMRVVAP